MVPKIAARCAGVALLVALSFGPLRAEDRVSGDLSLLSLSSLAVEDPAAALVAIEAALRDPAVAGDLRLAFDLNRLAAETLAAEGQHGEAAKLWFQLGQFAQRNRAVLQADPVILLRQSVAEYLVAGDSAAALRVQQAVVAELQDGGLTGPVLAEALTKLADLTRAAGDADKAGQIAEAAQQALKPFHEDGATRGPGEGFSRVEVFYATDRARTGESYPAASTARDAGRWTMAHWR